MPRRSSKYDEADTIRAPAYAEMASSATHSNAMADGALRAVERQYASITPDTPRTIHVLGLGSIGKLVAHSLRNMPDPPPVTLMLHRLGALRFWENSNRQITIKDGDFEIARGGFDAELLPDQYRVHGSLVPKEAMGDSETTPSNARELIDALQQAGAQAVPKRSYYGNSSSPIHSLVVCTKATVTATALLSVRDRISPDTTICFLQNGIGVIDEVNERVFPDPATRPNYIQGIVSHGVSSPTDAMEYNPFYSIHRGHGTIQLGLVPREGHTRANMDANDAEYPESARYLLQALLRAPALNAAAITPAELFQAQLAKLAVNSVINPITALIDCRNGGLVGNNRLARLWRLMLAETSHVISNLPELQGLHNFDRFSPGELERSVLKLSERTAHNISSMLADVRAGRKTEIDYINGYIVRRGEEMGFKPVVNYSMVQIVHGKQAMTARELTNDIPFAGKPPTGWAEFA